VGWGSRLVFECYGTAGDAVKQLRGDGVQPMIVSKGSRHGGVVQQGVALTGDTAPYCVGGGRGLSQHPGWLNLLVCTGRAATNARNPQSMSTYLPPRLA
jgi:hypothetical protein